ncbi:MAG: DNA polymerase III subunit delta' [Syntrophobacterales bacterium]|nr:DNA polymerase III subunit delta' [Syntrophobacterales bacterium]
MTDKERGPQSEVTPTLFFRDILGQARALGYLAMALSQGRLAHAYLFVGPEGVGRAAAATALAARLNCAGPTPEGEACGVCPSCRRLAAGTHPDFYLLRPTSEGRQPQIKIEQIREFRQLTAYPPVGGGWRVALIKPAAALNDAAANALLKTLEEPPPRHLIILAAAQEGDLFPTLVSRCQKLTFAPLPPALIRQELEKRGRPPAQAALAAALSGGSLGRALALDPEVLLTQRDQVLSDLDTLSRGGAADILAWAQRLAKSVAEADTFLTLAALWYRDLLVLRAGGPPELLAHQDRLPELQGESLSGRPETWLTRLLALSRAQRHLAANLNPELTLDILGFRLATT